MSSNKIQVPYDLHEDLVENIKVNRSRWLDIAEDLYYLKIGENFKKAVGEGIDTWVSYISQPEIGLSKGEADKLVRVYYELVVNGGYTKENLSGIPLKSLYLLADDGWTAGIVENAMHLSHRDFKELLHDSMTPTERTYSYLVMRKCNETGNMNKVKDISSEQIKQTFNLND